MASPLLQFLSQTRSAILHHHSKPPSSPFVLVLGNPSCDLDSFISATVYAFFHSRYSRSAQAPRLHIPLLNLPTTNSSELWRFSPEFGTALHAAVKGRTRTESTRGEDEDKTLLDNLITISDIRSSTSSPLHALFAKQATSPPAPKTDVVLVDHNAISIPLPDQESTRESPHLDVVGCIDHHIDESATPLSASPRIIKTGIGSCTTLVVQYLRDQGFWDRLTLPQQQHQAEGQPHKDRRQKQRSHRDENTLAEVELAKLSLAAILIDTANLTAEGKVSPLDRQVVAFLEDIITSHATTADQSPGISSTEPTLPTQQEWNRKAFYEQIAQSKQHAPDYLTLSEILARDFKSWVETSVSGSQHEEKKIKLGVSSVVKPVQWLIERKADRSAERLVEGLRAYAEREELDILAIMTAYTTTPASADASTHKSGCKGDSEVEGDQSKPDEAFARELLLLSNPPISNDFITSFEKLAREELKLQPWPVKEEDSQRLLDAFEPKPTANTGETAEAGPTERILGSARIWSQDDVAKSRKQVAPLLREAIHRHVARGV